MTYLIIKKKYEESVFVRCSAENCHQSWHLILLLSKVLMSDIKVFDLEVIARLLTCKPCERLFHDQTKKWFCCSKAIGKSGCWGLGTGLLGQAWWEKNCEQKPVNAGAKTGKWQRGMTSCVSDPLGEFDSF